MKNLINRSDLEQEIWLPVVGYEGLYEDSNLGRVKSLKYGKERILKLCKNLHGYLKVNLYKDGKMKPCYVHRLVAQTFIPNPHSLPEVNHINFDKTDNRVSNLEWCTSQYNNEYSKAKSVLQYSLSGQLVQEWSSAAEVEQLGGLNQSAISKCCLGKRKTHKGYIWKYKEQP